MLKEVFRGLWEAEIEGVAVVAGRDNTRERPALEELGVKAIF